MGIPFYGRKSEAAAVRTLKAEFLNSERLMCNKMLSSIFELLDSVSSIGCYVPLKFAHEKSLRKII